MKRLTIAIVMMILPVLALADDAEPKTPAVRGVMTKLDKAKADAKAVYDRSVARAVDDATRELDKLKSDVMKRGDLEEANRIAKAVEGVGETGSGDALSVANTVWEWDRKALGEEGWFRLNGDGTVNSGWHPKIGLWTMTTGGRVLVRFANNDELHGMTIEASKATVTDQSGVRTQVRRLK